MLRSIAVRGITIALVYFLVSPTVTTLADGRFSDARYLVPKNDKKMEEVEGTLVSNTKDKQVQFDSSGRLAFAVPFDKIKSMHYEKAAKPRYAAGLLVAWPLLFTKSKKHFLTIQYVDASGQGKFEIVRLDKANFRIALETLEADTGMKIERSEER